MCNNARFNNYGILYIYFNVGNLKKKLKIVMKFVELLIYSNITEFYFLF